MQHTVQASFRELVEASVEAFDEQLFAFFDPDESLSYELRVPRNDSGGSVGALVYISPKSGASMPEAWAAALDKHNLVWVGAHDSGNEVHVARRVGMALLAPAVAAQAATLSAGRTYLTGFSGGGRVASMMMPIYPERFAGALFICGANPMFAVSQEALDALERSPVVFVTGTGDFNLQDTQMAIGTFHQAGLANVQLMVVEGMGHELPKVQDIDRALDYFSGD